MIIRKYKDEDLEDMLQLFYDTVHTINIKDYSTDQVDLWAPKIPDKDKWKSFFENNRTFVATIDEEIIGFSDLMEDGYLNTMYVHKDYQERGVATELLNKIEKEALRLGLSKLTTEASITAKPFFQKKGFIVVEKQNKKHNGMIFINYIMKKNI